MNTTLHVVHLKHWRYRYQSEIDTCISEYRQQTPYPEFDSFLIETVNGLNDNKNIGCYMKDNQVVGFYILKDCPNQVKYIKTFYILTEFINKLAGIKLLSYLKDICKSNSKISIKFKEDLIELKRLLTYMGFKETNRVNKWDFLKSNTLMR